MAVHKTTKMLLQTVIEIKFNNLKTSWTFNFIVCGINFILFIINFASQESYKKYR